MFDHGRDKMCPRSSFYSFQLNMTKTNSLGAGDDKDERSLRRNIYSLLLLNFNHYIFTANSQQITAVNAESVYPDF
jgi:hypothetical protein